MKNKSFLSLTFCFVLCEMLHACDNVLHLYISFVYILRQLQEKCQEQDKELYATSVDPTKSFDLVSRTGLQLVMKRLGCPQIFLQMVILLHENQHGQVRLNGDLSEPFPITSGVKQGCVLTLTLQHLFQHDAQTSQR